jgi:hypothetical protein
VRVVVGVVIVAVDAPVVVVYDQHQYRSERERVIDCCQQRWYSGWVLLVEDVHLPMIAGCCYVGCSS